MDGTGRIAIANTSLVWPNDITIDFEVRNMLHEHSHPSLCKFY